MEKKGTDIKTHNYLPICTKVCIPTEFSNQSKPIISSHILIKDYKIPRDIFIEPH